MLVINSIKIIGVVPFLLLLLLLRGRDKQILVDVVVKLVISNGLLLIEDHSLLLIVGESLTNNGIVLRLLAHIHFLRLLFLFIL